MDVASRFPVRARGDAYRDVEGQTVPDDSGGESESNMVRRKFLRTTTDPDTTFRKPSLPASASRANLEREPSVNSRKRSTLRENIRVPSGPREYPSSPKQRGGSISTTAPSTADPANGTSRSFLPSSNSESYFSSRLTNVHTRQDSSGSRRATLATDSHTGTTMQTGITRDRHPGPLGDSLDFLPDVNFDDFQTSIKNYDGSTPLLSEFPAVHGGRILPKESLDEGARAMKEQAQQQSKSEGLGRTQSLRQRLAGSRQASGNQPPGSSQSAAPSSLSSLRNRRQSSMTQNQPSTGPVPAASAAKPPRKSVGPGLLTSMVRGSSAQHTPTGSESSLKPALARNSSLSKGRRTTIQPSASSGAELPRISTFTSTTQSRQNKTKSLLPPSRDSQDNPNTPNSNKSAKSNQNRAHTPSSSGGRRQSMATSGRASGLGARTISPTDARRLKRLSIAQAPPMPMGLPKAHTPTPQEEIANPMYTDAKMPEMPRIAQASPSLIPRKTSSGGPPSARASPERQFSSGGISLSTKSSYQSLVNSGFNGSTSRLPTPKSRNANQSGSSMGQYGEGFGEVESEELVPPVPAIPKAFESPKDADHPPFFSSTYKPSQSAFSDMSLDGNPLPTPRFLPTPRTSLDVPAETPRKRSGEVARPPHLRASTLSNGTSSVNVSTNGVPASARVQPDPNGRKNASLQPLRLPPLNLNPISTRTLHSATQQPRPSQEVDTREDWTSVATPEPKRSTKTPSTPMTASKATFFSRKHEDAAKNLRSSSSHFALRDAMGVDGNDRNVTKFWDDSEMDSASGMPIVGAKGRSAITPFASGSLPKGSSEYIRAAYQSAAEDGGSGEESYESMLASTAASMAKARTRAQTNTTIGSMKSGLSIETSAMSTEGQESPSTTDSTKKDKEVPSSGGGLRRKLSLGWKRAGSKAANHADNKDSPSQQHGEGFSGQKEKEEKPRSRLQKRSPGNANGGSGGAAAAMEMPPPKMPASASWMTEGGAQSASGRPSLEGQTFHARRKSQVPTSVSSVNLVDPTVDQQQPPPASSNGVKTRSQHTDNPTPIHQSSRASSWGNLAQSLRPGAKPAPAAAAPPPTRQQKPSSTFSALVKDKDDLAADDEMHRLSRKRKDVDAAARESEDLRKRANPRSPVTAEAVLHGNALAGSSGLNVFERGEVVDFEAEGIYFTGNRSAKKIIGSLNTGDGMVSADGKAVGNSGNNYGYDDERGDYNIVLGDHLAYRYEVVDVLGKGSFGQVVRCVDHKLGGVVAVKIIRNKKRFHQQALVEVGILGRLGVWDPDGAHATLTITTSFYFRSHLCIVTPCLSINLYELIRAHNFTGFSLPLIRRFTRQLLACLVLLQQKRIIHCDLKPENILLCDARRADVRVIDFGSSCREEEKVYTYIQSRFYRSPEVILGSSYGLGIDMWSLGCILAELWTGYPIFPGENEQEQLACIMEIFGPPDRHLVERCSRKKLFFDSVGKPRVTVSSKGRRRRPSSKTLAQALKSEDEAFLDFVARCLRWDPDRRLKASEAVSHPFVTGVPWSQRAMGMSDEARRTTAKVRSTAAVSSVPSGGSGPNPSPVKRMAGGTGPHIASTPARDRAPRGIPETPQTALRNGVPVTASSNANAGTQGSPIKITGPISSAARRHSSIASAGAAAVTGGKRASNGAALGPAPTAGVGRPAATGTSLAQMAARESMGGAGAGPSASAGNVGSGRWKG